MWALLALVLVVGSLALLRANRLDRLHARADGAAAALCSALDRRAEVATAVADALDAAPPAVRTPALAPAGTARAVAGASPAPASTLAQRLRTAAGNGRLAGPDEREPAENELTALLAAVDPVALPAQLAADLTDAQDRVVIARRVHNDAVRDALAVRATRLVRWLALVGAVPAPRYFEITEPSEHRRPGAEPTHRRAARVLLLDEANRVLLFEGVDPTRPQEPFWVTVGGAIKGGERPHDAALRELAEETGLRLSEDQLTGPVWQRDVLFAFDGEPYLSRELFFVARTTDLTVDTSGFDDVEQRTVLRHRWWTAGELRQTSAVVYPAQLAELLPTVTNGWDGRTVTVK